MYCTRSLGVYGVESKTFEHADRHFVCLFAFRMKTARSAHKFAFERYAMGPKRADDAVSFFSSGLARSVKPIAIMQPIFEHSVAPLLCPLNNRVGISTCITNCLLFSWKKSASKLRFYFWNFFAGDQSDLLWWEWLKKWSVTNLMHHSNTLTWPITDRYQKEYKAMLMNWDSIWIETQASHAGKNASAFLRVFCARQNSWAVEKALKIQLWSFIHSNFHTMVLFWIIGSNFVQMAAGGYGNSQMLAVINDVRQRRFVCTENSKTFRSFSYHAITETWLLLPASLEVDSRKFRGGRAGVWGFVTSLCTALCYFRERNAYFVSLGSPWKRHCLNSDAVSIHEHCFVPISTWNFLQTCQKNQLKNKQKREKGEKKRGTRRGEECAGDSLDIPSLLTANRARIRACRTGRCFFIPLFLLIWSQVEPYAQRSNAGAFWT